MTTLTAPKAHDWLALLANSSMFGEGSRGEAVIATALVYANRLEVAHGGQVAGLSPADTFVATLRLASKMETQKHAHGADWLTAMHAVRWVTAYHPHSQPGGYLSPSLHAMRDAEAVALKGLGWHLTVSDGQRAAALKALRAQPWTHTRAHLGHLCNRLGLGTHLAGLIGAGIH